MENQEEAPRCYICDEETDENAKDIFSSTTNYTHSSIYELLEKLTGQELVKVFDENKCLGCLDCIEKINEYDLASVTTERIQKELIFLLQQTTEKYCQSIAEITESKNDHELELEESVVLDDEVTYIVKEEQITDCYNEPLEEETDEYEIRFFTADTDNENSDSREEVHAEPEYINYEEAIRNDDDDDMLVELSKNSKKTKKTIASEKRTSKPKKKTFCKICKVDFTSFKMLEEHRKEKHDDGERLVCDICGVRYKTRSALKIHIDMHNGISPFNCEICGKNFTQKGALKRHTPIHTGERPYQCDKCGKQFTHYSSFHMHNLAHDDIRDKKCAVCGLLLRSSSHLNRHMLVHTGQKPHACPKCGQRFAQRYNMMSHLRSHQGIHRRKKHSCDICNKGFAKESMLNKHIQEKACSPSENKSVYQIVEDQNYDECNVVDEKNSTS